MDNDIFNKALDAFVETLAPDERALFSSCSSAEQLLADVRRLDPISKDRARGRGFLERITVFSEKLAPYFEVIGIIISSNPQYSAVVWGAIRLVLQLASNYTTFFDKLTRNLERFAQQFFQYDLLASLCKRAQPNEYIELVKSSLQDIYSNIFQFLRCVARVLTRKDGKSKHPQLVGLSLAWKPFDKRFGDILEQIEFSHNVLRDTIQLDQIRAEMQERESAEKERRESEEERHRAEQTRRDFRDTTIKIESERQKLLQERQKADTERVTASKERRRLFEEKQEFAQVRLEELSSKLLTAVADMEEKNKEVLAKVEGMNDEFGEVHREFTRNCLRRWLSPPEFLQEYERALDSREEGTASWLFEETTFEKWRTSVPDGATRGKFGPECLWIQGNPGYGKTILAATAVEELRYTTANEHLVKSRTQADVFYFFFRSGVPTMNSNMAAHRAILAQILQTHWNDIDAIDKFTFAMNETSGGQMIASRDEMRELLHVLAQSLGRFFLVLDGIDECSDNAVLIQDLLKLTYGTEVMLLMFSRPNVPSLFWAVPDDQQFAIGRSTSGDIQIYLTGKIKMLKDQHLLPTTADTEDLVTHLLAGADGMFLWARLMLSYLTSPALTRLQRVRIIETVTLPEGLESMYERMGNLIDKGYHVEQRLAKSIIIWLTFSKRRLTVRELQTATASVDSADSLCELDDIQDFIRTVVLVCAGLVEPEIINSRVHGGEATFFRFIHLSAKEYYSAQSGLVTFSIQKPFGISAWESHLEISSRCLNFLSFEVPAQPLGGQLGLDRSDESLDQTFPLCSYAACHWVDHLLGTIFDIARVVKSKDFAMQDRFGGLLLVLSRFLSQGFVMMAWIEAMYICGHSPPYDGLERWLVWAKNLDELQFSELSDSQRLLGDVMDITQYLQEVDKHWGSQLRNTPGCIWEEVTAFTPCRLLPRTTAVKVHSLASDETIGDYTSTKCLCKVSESTPNGLLLGVLSIWPSRAYETVSQEQHKRISLSALRELAKGWIARYELWSIAAEPTRVLDHRFSMGHDEVWLQMKQSLCKQTDSDSQTDSGWGMQFPMAISPNVRMFIVLRTFYCLKPIASQSGLILEASTITMGAQDNLSANWSSRKSGFTTDSADQVDIAHLDAAYRFQQRDIYLYWMSFHPDGCTLLFVDQDLNGPGTAAILTIESHSGLVTPLLKPFPINSHGSLLLHPEWSRGFNQVKVIYNPVLPLLGFSFAGMLYLWAYQQDSKGPVPLCTIDLDPELRFSDCGRYVYLSEPLEGRLIRKPIPLRLLTPRRGVEEPNPIGGLLLEAPVPGRSVEIIASNTQQPSSIRSELQTREDGSFLDSRDPKVDSLDIGLWNKRTIAQSYQLMKLPVWAATGKANVVAGLSDNRAEIIKIILNKAAKPWYSVSDHDGHHLPAVVGRDDTSPKVEISARLNLALSNLAITNGQTAMPKQIPVGETIDLDHYPRSLATKFLESWWSSEEKGGLTAHSLIPRAIAVGHFAKWIARSDGVLQQPGDAVYYGIFGLMLAAGSDSPDVRVRNATRDIVDWRNKIAGVVVKSGLM